MKKIIINPLSDPRRAEYWVNKKIQIELDAFMTHFKANVSETEELEQIYETSAILKAAFESGFSEPHMEDMMILHIGEIMVDGDGYVWSAYYQLKFITKDGERLFETNEGYSLEDDYYPVGPEKYPWEQLWQPIITEIERFLDDNPQLRDIELDDIHYDTNYDPEEHGIFSHLKKEPKPKRKAKPGTKDDDDENIIHLAYHKAFIIDEKPAKFEREPNQLTLTFDADGNYQLTSEVEEEGLDAQVIINRLAKVLARMSE